MYKLETSPLTISSVFRHGWLLYKSSWWHVFVWSLLVAIMHIIPNLFRFVGYYYRDITGQLTFSWVGLIVSFILMIPESFFLAVLFYTIYSVAKEQKVNTAMTLNVAKNRLFHLYIAMVVYSIIMHIGLALFIAPAVFLAILFSMVFPNIVVDDLPVYNSFDTSARLVWGKWWQTFFILALPYIVIYIIRRIFSSIRLEGKWSFLINAIILAITMPYFYSALLVQFNNLKIIKSLPKPISRMSQSVLP